MDHRKANERIAVICPANLKYAPYAENYLRQLKAHGVDYRVLSWNKRDIEEQDIAMEYHFPVSDAHRKKMFFGHGVFADKCRRYIRRNKISKLIVLTAAPAFFLGTGFLKKFAGNYILDIRDDSPLVRRFPKTFRKICAMARQVVTSSPGFNPWIPTDTILCHNADTAAIALQRTQPPKEKGTAPYSIVFAGVLNESRINIDMLRHIGGDARFRFQFIGRTNQGKEDLMAFVQAHGLESVTCQGTYNKDDIYDIYRRQADLVNILRERCTVNRNALPNKLYDAVLAGVPVVVFDHNEAVATYVRQYNLGLVLEENMATLGDTIVQQISTFDYPAYARGRAAFLEKVLSDMARFRTTVENFIHG